MYISFSAIVLSLYIFAVNDLAHGQVWFIAAWKNCKTGPRPKLYFEHEKVGLKYTVGNFPGFFLKEGDFSKD